LKAYERFVVWLNYFNSELKRAQGRRVPLSAAVRSPTFKELEEACLRLKLDPQGQRGVYPRSGRTESGYLSVKKAGKKQKVVMMIAKQLSVIRGEEQKASRKV